MIRTELRKWDKYVNKKEWKDFVKSLSKQDYSIYQSFNSYRSHIVRTEKKMDKLKTQIKELKERQNEYYKKLTLVNSQIDHLRKQFNFSISVSPWDKDRKDINWYCLGTITRSGYNKISFNLGNMKNKVRPRLMDYYKTNYPKKKKFDYQDLDTWKGRQDFCEELNKTLSKVKPQIREHIRKNPKMKSLKKSIDFFFPV